MTAYYNENDPLAAQWLRNLIAAGHITPGDVDERSITEVRPDDLVGYDQCHFFAGVGVWSHALRQAGWPDDRPVWTGSCPCQPFSAAGKGEGAADPRHLWPEWFRLIREHRPVAIFGEQVGAAIRHGWFDLVSADLEAEGYAIGAAVVGAHSVGAPHIRQRLYFVAQSMDDSTSARWDSTRQGPEGQARNETRLRGPECGRPTRELADGHKAGCGIGGTAHDDDRRDAPRHDADRRGEAGELGDAERAESARFGQHSGSRVCKQEAERPTRSGGTVSWWGNADWLWCTDQKYRPTQPGLLPLAHGATQRVGRLRAYGNAICAPQAAAFIEAFLGVSK